MIRPLRCFLLVLVATVASGGAAAGCFGSGNSGSAGDGGTFDVTGQGSFIAPSTESFGTIGVGAQSAGITVTVNNAGTVPTGAITVGLTGADAGDFGIDSDGCASQALQPHATCTIQVHFKPSKAMAEEATLAIAADPGGAATTTLTGTGAGASVLSFAPSTQSLGTVAVGATSAPAAFTLTNGGSAPSGNVTVALTGTDGVDFSLASDGCSGKSLAAGATCDVGVSLSPKTVGSKAASMTATAAGVPGTATATLAGTAVSAATFAVTPSPFDFGPVSQGTTPAPEQTFSVKNTGGAASTVPSVTASGSNDFAVTDNACTSAVPAGGTCTFGITFTPTAIGVETTTVTVGGMSVTPVTVKVQGTGLAPATITINPTTQSLGSVLQGAAGTDSAFVVTNAGGVATGTLAVQLGGTNGDQFALGTDGCTGQTLAPAATCTVNAHAAPKVGGTVGALTALLTVSGTPGGAAPATLTATALAPATLTVSPTSQPMGTVAGGSTSGDLPFVVTNTGGVTSGTLQAVLGGANAGAFGLGTDQCSGQTLAAGVSCTVNVHFSPPQGSIGTEVATLSVAASPGGTATANLTGTATSPAAIQITPASQPYPNTPQGTASSDVTFSVSNTGGVASGTLTATLGGANVGQFAIGTDGCTGKTLAATGGSTCSVTVHFAPSVGTLGLQQQTLSVSGAPGGTGTANLTGTATTPLALTPASPTLASGAYEDPGATTTLTVTSVSLSPVGPLAIAVPAQFSLDAAKTTCSGATLTKAAPTCAVGVYLNPTAAAKAGAVTGTLTVSAGANTTATDLLASTVLTPATLVLTTAAGGVSPFPFGMVRQNVPFTQSFVLTNNGAVTSGTVAVAVSGAAPGGNDFTIPVANDTCTGTLASTKSCTFDVTFTPSTTTAETATLGATTTAGLGTSGTLTGTGAQPVLEWENANLQVITSYPYGGVDVAVAGAVVPPASATFNLYNAGTVAANKLSLVGTLAAGYTVTSSTCIGQGLNPGARCAVTVSFQNTTPCASVSTTLALTDGAATSTNLALSATGVASTVDFVLTFTPASPLHLAINTPSAFSFTLQNCGATPAATAGYNVTEVLKDAAAEFTALTNTANCIGQTLGQLQSCTFGVDVTGGPSDGTYTSDIIVVFGNQQTVNVNPEVITP